MPPLLQVILSLTPYPKKNVLRQYSDDDDDNGDAFLCLGQEQQSGHRPYEDVTHRGKWVSPADGDINEQCNQLTIKVKYYSEIQF